MTVIDRMAEQHFLEYESRLKHIDELFTRAKQSRNEREEFDDELNSLRAERLELLSDLNAIKKKSLEEWQTEGIEKTGPMIIWDVVAKKLEKLVERIEQ